jgi:hypothetical protein
MIEAVIETSPLWIVLGLMLVAILVVDGGQ